MLVWGRPLALVFLSSLPVRLINRFIIIAVLMLYFRFGSSFVTGRRHRKNNRDMRLRVWLAGRHNFDGGEERVEGAFVFGQGPMDTARGRRVAFAHSYIVI
ncbi:hypothetical protein EXIGLDRAFT_361572 [Exidia glandulosa HHB12029]|uniref:Uncharacterized protein n=1 Tax=Exidia glandulosa HHB12029 TaxID=1314781 RepID=A0A165L8P9_EXIGL|nr:hypothetical protein EXIGLDRAFT_361572 [Exidia glandulosa HHB12029]